MAPYGRLLDDEGTALPGDKPVDEDEVRAPVVARWRWLLEVAGPMSDLFQRSTGGGEEAVSRALADACYCKSTATLRKRACACPNTWNGQAARMASPSQSRAFTTT